MKALITGSEGFIGRHFARHLERSGRWDIIGIDIAEPGCPVDARDYFRHESATYDLVIHAAAVVGGRSVIEGAPLALASNLELDAAMFAWAERTHPGRVVYISSAAAYPVAFQDHGYLLTEADIDPQDPMMPDELYGWAKLTGEMLAIRARAAGVPVTVVRPFSGYGTGQGTDYPFGAFIARARRRDDPFEIWGDGTQVRDFIHVDDIVCSVMVMTEHGIDGPVNLGSGEPRSMTQLARLVCDAAGYNPRIAFRPGSPSGVAFRACSPAMMRTFYQPQVTLEEGIRRALEAR